jgi:hypothetical protein
MPKLETNAEAYPRLLDWLRYFCAFMLYMYGISKLIHLQFNMQSQLARQAVGSLTVISTRGFILASLGSTRPFSG